MSFPEPEGTGWAYPIMLVLHLFQAAGPAVAAIDQAKSLLATRGHVIAPVVVIDSWPANAASREAIAIKGTIFVNRNSIVLRAAIRSPRYQVALASLLLHEQAHLGGASERQALEVELDWLTINRADRELIEATKQSIELESEREKKAGKASPAAGELTK